MSDQRLRELELAAATGGPEEVAELARRRLAHGLCPWCGVAPAGHHVLIASDDGSGKPIERTCCCDMTCALGLKGAAFRGVDWTRCDGLGPLHCLGCPAVECKVAAAEAAALDSDGKPGRWPATYQGNLKRRRDG